MTLPPIGASAELDLSNWSQGVEQMLSDEGTIGDAMQGIVDAVTGASDSLSLLDADVSANVDISVDDTSLLDADALLEGIDGEHDASVTTDADTTPLETYDGKLGTIIQTAGAAVLAVAALGGAAVTGALAVGVRAVTDLDDALDSVEARARTDIPEAGQIIQDTFEAGLGESRDQIGQTITLASQLGVANEDLGVATDTAFRTALVTGDDVNTTLRTMQTLVRTGLVPDFTTAGDLLVTGFQDGANRAGDLNTTLTNNAGVLHDMGFSGEEALGLIVTGLDNGYDSAGELVNQLLIVRQRLVENSDAVKTALADVGQTDEAEAYLNGTISGGQFMAGLSDAIGQAPQSNRLDLITAIFGPRGARGLSEEQVAGLSDAQEALDAYKGNLQEASSILLTDFDPTVQRIFRKAEDRVGEFLSSDQIDLPGKIAAIEAAFNTFLDQLESGSTVGEALEIAIDVPGLADQINHFESIVGNLILNLAEFAADILEAINQGDAAATLRQSVAPLAVGQLQFDLNVATSQDEIMQAVSTAAARGLSSAQVNDALSQTVNNALSSGDLSGAQTLLDGITALEGNVEQISALQQQIDDLSVERGRTLDTGRLEAINTQIGELNEQLQMAQTAQSLKIDIDAGDLAAELNNAEQEAFGGALQSGDFDAARAIATQIGDPLLTQIADTMEQAQQATQAGMNKLMATIYTPTGTGGGGGGPVQGAAPPNKVGGGAGAGMTGNPFEGVLTAIDQLTASAQTHAPQIDAQLQVVSDGTTEINTTAQTALPEAQEVFAATAAQIIVDWTPVLLLFQQTYEAMQALDGGGGAPGGGGGGTSGRAETRDKGGDVRQGEWYDVNGEAFLSPFDAVAMGAGSSQSLMSGLNLNGSGGSGGGDTTNNRVISVNNHYNIASQAEALSHADRVADQLRGF